MNVTKKLRCCKIVATDVTIFHNKAMFNYKRKHSNFSSLAQKTCYFVIKMQQKCLLLATAACVFQGHSYISYYRIHA